MKKILLSIIVCGFIVLGITGCGNEKEVDKLKDTYNKVEKYFGNENNDRSNLASYYIDEINDVVVVELIDNSNDKQEEFIKDSNVDTKYIRIEQGGPYYTSSGIDFYISKPEEHNDIKFNNYYSVSGRTIYLAGNVEEFYIIDEDVKVTLKQYISNTFQTLDDSIKSITDMLLNEVSMDDGGTTIYKSEEKDITMIVCHTLAGNRNIYIGDYSMEFDQGMCK